ncbi:MAG: UbiD family decarboxylase [Methanomicrobiales archaeon]|nr:UbiD family decarboxylase [Methanomicrobiales archaeon]
MREFLERMREKDQVVEVEGACSTQYEAPKMASTTRKILFFHRLDGSRGIMNLTASREVLGEGLGVPWMDIPRELARSCYEGRVVEEETLSMRRPNLSKLPVMRHYPGDAGPYITGGIVFSHFDGVTNASIHRMLVLDDRRVVARLVEGRHTYLMHRKAWEQGEALPVAVAIGVHPAVIFASCSRVPEGKELSFAAELRGGEILVNRCPNGVPVPDAEIILQGFIGDETTREGPFVDITGTYDHVREQPVIEFSGMLTKKDFIYHGILPGGDEHKILMGTPYEPKIYRAVGEVTQVRNVVLTNGGCGYLHAVIQVKKSTQGDAKNAIMAAFAAHTSLKHVVVVDEDIDPFDPNEVEFAIATRVRGDRDLMMISGVRGSSLDPTRAEDGTNVKVGVDATMVMGREEKFKRARWV